MKNNFIKTSYLRFIRSVNLYFNLEFLDDKSKASLKKSVLILTLFYSILNPLFLTYLVDNQVAIFKHQINLNVKEYDEMDLTSISNITGAISVRIETLTLDKSEIVFAERDKEGSLVFPQKAIDSDFQPLIFQSKFYDNWFISNNFELILKNKISINSFYATQIKYRLNLGSPSFITMTAIYISLLSALFIIIITLILVRNAVKIRTSDLIAKIGNEALLATKNAVKFTESFHHEVKTPLAVLTNVFDRMEDILDNIILTPLDYNNYTKIVEDAKELKSLRVTTNLNFASIYQVLERMKVIKTTKYSNGNLSIYEVIQNSFIGLQVHFKNAKHTFKIDEKLKKVTAGEGISNEDVLNIFTNHIRNSLEASASHLEIRLKNFDRKTKQIYLYIVDNGNGIPNDVIPLIYLPDFSTKKLLKNTGENEGMGMYLCKTILHEAGGEAQLVESSDRGTIFLISFPVIMKVKVNENNI